MQDITQQQIKKNNIVNRYLKLKSLPDNINYQSLLSMSYYENYKGQNPNSPGKNILNIGEQHFTTDEGFYDFIDFLNHLIKKNFYLNSCLDFVIEGKFDRDKDGWKFQRSYPMSISTERNSDFTIDNLRDTLPKKSKGFRVHETDTRLILEGFYASLIFLLNCLEDMTDKLPAGLYSTVAAFIYNIDNEQYIKKKYNQSLFWEYFLYIERKGMLKNTIEYIDKQNMSQQEVKYHQNRQKQHNLKVEYATKFLDSVLGYMMDFWGFNDKTELTMGDIDIDMKAGLSPKGYYDYLERKMDKNEVESYILKHKDFDKKFAKQLDNIDPDYFVENPKDLIFVYFFKYLPAITRTSWSSLFYDIQTVSRIFRKFKNFKGRFKTCDEENKSLRNIIVYSGNNHTRRINLFLKELPRLRLEPNNIFYIKYIDTEQKQVSPKLSFGNFDYPLGFYSDSKKELQFPTNFDYFGYNGKIINKLKQETNVQNYLQIEKKLFQKQEERKMKQRQERMKKELQERMKKELQEKEKIQRQKQRNKKYTMELNQFGKEFKEFNGPGIFTGTLINSKPNKGEIQFENGNYFRGKYNDKYDSLYGVLTFTDGTKFDGSIKKDNKKKYNGKLFINNEDYIEGVLDSDFNIAKSNITEFKIDNNEYTYLHEYNMLRAPEQLEDKVSEQKLNQLGKQLFQKQNVNYDVLKQFSDKLILEYL